MLKVSLHNDNNDHHLPVISMLNIKVPFIS